MNDFEYLKRRIIRRKDGNTDVRVDNVSAIKPTQLPNERRSQQDSPLEPTERTSLRSLLGEMQWPVREGFAEYGYDVSDLQQRVPEATVSTILRANSVLRGLQKRASRLALRLPRGDGTGRFAVGLSTDASFDRQPRGGSQQGAVVFIGDRRLIFSTVAPVATVA